MKKLKEIISYREMIHMMVKKNLRGRYKRSFLGFAWTFVNPLLQLGVYTIVFSIILKSNIENFSLYLFVGLIPWIGLSSSVLEGAVCIISEKHLVTKIYFPREVLPIITTLTNFINMGLCMIVVIIACFIFNGLNFYLLIYLIPVILIEFIFALGISFIVSALTVYFMDLQHIISVVLMGWQFLTPIMYPVEYVPESLRTIFYLNPMTSIIVAYRNILYDKVAPQLSTLSIALLLGLGMLMIGFLIFNKLQKRFAEVL